MKKSLEELVKDNLIKTWLSGKGGISDSKFMKLYTKKIAPFGYTFDETHDEFNRQMHQYFN